MYLQLLAIYLLCISVLSLLHVSLFGDYIRMFLIRLFKVTLSWFLD